jgi:hypothetical protein
MVQTVKIRKEGDKIKVNFMYNDDLVEIMRQHSGYFFRKEKAWIFPLSKHEALYNQLTDAHYDVQVTVTKGQTQLPIEKVEPVDNWKDKSTVFVAGHCKKCGTWGFCSKEGLCGRCM